METGRYRHQPPAAGVLTLVAVPSQLNPRACGLPPCPNAAACVTLLWTTACVTACGREGKLAGLETVKLIREPVAAALAYGLDLSEEQVRQTAGCVRPLPACSKLPQPAAGVGTVG